MGTNYYVKAPPSCNGACSRHCHGTAIHLGRWTNGEFHFRGYPDADKRPEQVTWDVVDYDSWKRLLELGEIETEYGQPITAAEMTAKVQPTKPRSRREPIHRDQFTDNLGNRFSPYEFC